MELKIRSQSQPKRCEICHQADQFDAEHGVCARCSEVALPLLPPATTDRSPHQLMGMIGSILRSFIDVIVILPTIIISISGIGLIFYILTFILTLVATRFFAIQSSAYVIIPIFIIIFSIGISVALGVVIGLNIGIKLSNYLQSRLTLRD